MAEVTNSGKIVQRGEIVLDVEDFLPPGLTGVRQKTALETVEPELNSGSTSEVDLRLDQLGDFSDSLGESGALPVPTDMKIISQTIKISANRSVTVDVVIETSDFPGVEELEARIKNDGLLPTD